MSNNVTTNFIKAASQGNVDEVRRLASRVRSVDVVDSQGYTAVYTAVIKKQVAVLQTLLEEFDANPNIANNIKDTPLALAARMPRLEPKERVKIIRLLLSNGASRTKTGLRGQTPMQWARKKRHNSAVDALTPVPTVRPGVCQLLVHLLFCWCVGSGSQDPCTCCAKQGSNR